MGVAGEVLAKGQNRVWVLGGQSQGGRGTRLLVVLRPQFPVLGGVESQNTPGPNLPGKKNQGMGQAQGEGQGARDTGHLCGWLPTPAPPEL